MTLKSKKNKYGRSKNSKYRRKNTKKKLRKKRTCRKKKIIRGGDYSKCQEIEYKINSNETNLGNVNYPYKKMGSYPCFILNIGYNFEIGPNIKEFNACNIPDAMFKDNVRQLIGVYSNPDKYNKISQLKIGREIVSIGKNVFKECSTLESIIINPGKDESDRAQVENLHQANPLTICEGAFSSCTKLTEIDIPRCIKIEKEAFKNCSQLNKVTISGYEWHDSEIGFNQVPQDTIIDEKAFEGCTNLREITLPSKIIGKEMFFKFSSLNNVSLLNTEIIGESAFNSCKLNKLILPSTTTEINKQAFQNNKDLVQVVFGQNKMKILSFRTFYGCENLSTFGPEGTTIGKMVIPSNIEFIDGGVFNSTNFSEVICMNPNIIIEETAFPLGNIKSSDGNEIKLLKFDDYKTKRKEKYPELEITYVFDSGTGEQIYTE